MVTVKLMVSWPAKGSRIATFWLLLEISSARVRKTLAHKSQRMEPMAGIEPATDGLRNRCSTAELHWLPRGPIDYRPENDGGKDFLAVFSYRLLPFRFDHPAPAF